MQFTIASVAFMATAVMAGVSAPAESTVYSTKEVTITSCAASVTDCPARSTVVSTTSYPVIATTAPVVSAIPSPYQNGTAPAPYPTSAPVASPSLPVGGNSGASASGPAPVVSVLTISSCVPTVIYSTITVTPAPSAPAVPATVKPVPSASAGIPSGPGNSTSPAATATPTAFTGSAAGLTASAGFAAVAGLVAVFLA